MITSTFFSVIFLLVSQLSSITGAVDCEGFPTAVSLMQDWFTYFRNESRNTSLNYDDPIYTCMLAGHTVGTYQQLTVALMGSVDANYDYYFQGFGGSGEPPATIIVVLTYDCQIDAVSGLAEWIVGPIALISGPDFIIENGFCSSCTVYDAFQDCTAACDPSCNTGLMRCTGRLSSDCCAAYNSTGYCVPPSKISDCIDDINLFNSTACPTNTSLSLPVVVGSIVGICIVATLLLFLQIIPSFLFRVSSHQNKEFVDI